MGQTVHLSIFFLIFKFDFFFIFTPIILINTYCRVHFRCLLTTYTRKEQKHKLIDADAGLHIVAANLSESNTYKYIKE